MMLKTFIYQLSNWSRW